MSALYKYASASTRTYFGAADVDTAFRQCFDALDRDHGAGRWDAEFTHVITDYEAHKPERVLVTVIAKVKCRPDDWPNPED